MESLTMNKDKGIISIFDGGMWLALFSRVHGGYLCCKGQCENHANSMKDEGWEHWP